MMFKAYRFPSGHSQQASRIFSWLQKYYFSPSWLFENREDIIQLPVSQKKQLQKMQGENPARWGKLQSYE